MVHRWKCHVIRNGRRDSPEHTYGPFDFPSLGRVQRFFERMNSMTLLICRVCKPT